MDRGILDTTDLGARHDQRLDRGDVHSIGAMMLRRLRDDIISTQLRPGTKLALHHLARQYGVGITPLRDALGQLAGDGLVIMESQKGFRVAPVSLHDFEDLCDVRLRIELMALGMAVDRRDAEWNARMRHAFEVFTQFKQRVGEDGPISLEWEDRHRAVHMTLLSGCGSPTLIRFVGQIHDRLHRYRRIALPEKSYMCALADDHSEIINAAIDRDKTRCLTLLEHHIVSSSELIQSNMAFDPAPTPLAS